MTGRRILSTLVLLLALGIVFALWWYVTTLHSSLAQLNDSIATWAVSGASWGSTHDFKPAIIVLLTILELAIAALVVAWIVRGLISHSGNIVSRFESHLVMLTVVSSSLLMALWEWMVLWGEVYVFGLRVLPAYNPVDIYPLTSTMLGFVGVWYLVIQLSPLALQPIIGVGWVVVNFVSSMVNAGIYVAALFSYLFGTTYVLSDLRWHALIAWSAIPVFEIMIVMVITRLQRRDFFAQSEVVAVPGIVAATQP